MKDNKNKKENNIQYFKVLWDYLKPDKWLVILFVILTVLHSIEPLVYPVIWANALEALLSKNMEKFLIYIIIYDGIAILLNFILWYPRSSIYNKLEMNYMARVSKDLYAKVNKLPAIAFEDIGVGEYTNRLVQDPDRVLDILSRLIKLISKFVVVIIVLILAFRSSIFLAIEIIVFGLIVFIYSKCYFPIIKKNNEEYKKQSDTYVKRLTQNITGIRDIKALFLSKTINKLTNNNIDELSSDNKKIRSSELKYYVGLDVIYDIFQFIVMMSCGLLFTKDIISFAMFVMLESYIWRISDAVQSLSDFGAGYNKVIVSLKRMDEILNNKLYKDEIYGDKVLDNTPGNIEFRDVYFRYPTDEDNTLKGLNMVITPHKKIAIVGKSGQGKSTIFNILSRYFDVSNGSVLIDGIDIRDLTEESLRNNISVIRQSPYLFNQSIMDNFKFVKEDITLDEVRNVCKKAYIDDYIMGLPKQYNTIIGEGGVNLSGGQKQRIAIARTLIKDTNIILFDEATSALDNESQNYIKKTMDNLVKNHTIVIVAHRLSTIMDADIIYVVDNGKVIEFGTHDQLMVKSKVYKKLYAPEVLDLDIL